MSFIKQNKLKFRIFNSYLTSTISITFILLLLGIFSLLLLNVRTLSTYAKENIVISVILKPNINDAEILSLQKELDIKPFCKETDFVSKNRAAEELRSSFDENFVEILGYNPLPASINIKLNAEYSNTDSISVIGQKLSNNKTVDFIHYHKSLVHEVDKNVKNIGLIISTVSLLLLLIAITLINNTIRLEIYSKRFTIKTMQLVGATKKYILKPFIIKSFFHGMITSLIAMSILVVFILYFQNNVEGLVQIKNIIFVFIILICTGVIITVGSTSLAVIKYVRTQTDNLY